MGMIELSDVGGRGLWVEGVWLVVGVCAEEHVCKLQNCILNRVPEWRLESEEGWGRRAPRAQSRGGWVRMRVSGAVCVYIIQKYGV